MNTRVVWTKEERRTVFQNVPEPVTERWVTMWKRVMQVLPENRRRSLVSSAQSTLLKHEYEKWREENPTFHPPQQSMVKPPPEARVEPMETATATEPHIIVIEKLVKVEPDYLNIPTSTLLRLLGERILIQEQFEQRFRQMEDMIEAKRLAERTHRPELGPLPPPEPEREKKVRIVIIGLLDGQQNEVEERCANTPKPVKLRFYDTDRNAGGDGVVDYAILTKHTNHQWWDRMKSMLPSDRVFFVDGGIGGVVQKVYDICSRRD